MKTYPDVHSYLASFPKEVQALLKTIRTTIKRSAPKAKECVSYGMPAYKLNNKPLVYFAAFKNHIGLYATPSAHTKFAKELSKYKQGKGSVQFPMNQPLPMGLITKMVKFKIAQLKIHD